MLLRLGVWGKEAIPFSRHCLYKFRLVSIISQGFTDFTDVHLNNVWSHRDFLPDAVVKFGARNCSTFLLNEISQNCPGFGMQMDELLPTP